MPSNVNKSYLTESNDEEDWGNWNASDKEDNSNEKLECDNIEILDSNKSPQKVIEVIEPIKSMMIENPKPFIPRTISSERHKYSPHIIANKDRNLYPVYKNFYKEHPETTLLTDIDVEQILLANNNIIVQELTTYPLDCDFYNDEVYSDDDVNEAEIEQIPIPKGIPKPIQTFYQAFWNYKELLEIVEKMEFEKPTPIQTIGWPVLLSGRDFIGIAQTGTGKTLTFILPALIHIEGQVKKREHRRGPTVLVLSPTRELAQQIEAELLKIKYHGIKSSCCYGGADKQTQVYQLRENPEIVVGTPGRLNDLVDMGYLYLRDVSYLVLDEADRMLDMGFEPQIVRLTNMTRKHRQSVMTSATWPEHVRSIALLYMNSAIQVNVGSFDLIACENVKQELRRVENTFKTDELCEILINMSSTDKIIVFVTRKVQCRSLSQQLEYLINQDRLGFYASVCQINGDMTQEARERSLCWFRDGESNVLIATNVASRGLDISDITCVVNYDFPKDIEEYVHRVGRTGRAGKIGRSITFMNDDDWKHAMEMRKILIQSKQEVPGWLLQLKSVRLCNDYPQISQKTENVRLTSEMKENYKKMFSFDMSDDDFEQPNSNNGSFFDSFQAKHDVSMISKGIGRGRGKNKKKNKENPFRRPVNIDDELCNDIDDEDDDFFEYFQQKYDPKYKTDLDVEVPISDSNIIENDEEDADWW